MKTNRFVGLLAILLLVGCSDDEGPSLSEQFQIDTELIDQYISDNELDVQIDPESSIRYYVTNEGDGLAPYLVESVRLTYTGRLLSTGEVVESAVSEVFEWDELLPAWHVILNNFEEGGSLTFFMPSIYAYGSKGTASIPPNANLIYEVTLDEVVDDQLKSELADIDQYLIDNEIQAETHPSGIRYIIHEEGTGTTPNGNNYVQVAYEGKVLGEETNFDSSNSATFQLGGLIPGWQIAIPLIKPGGSMTIYIPGTLGYGEAGNGPNIPSNANLVFDIDLLNVQ